MRAGDDVGHELGLGRIRNRWLQHTDNSGLPVAQPDGFVEHGLIALQDRAPEPVRQYRDPRGRRAVVTRVDEAAEDRTQAHHLEIRATSDAGPNLARVA